MQTKNYIHKNILFDWDGGLNIRLQNNFVYLKLQINNGSIGWRLNRKTWLSYKQLKKIINE